MKTTYLMFAAFLTFCGTNARTVNYTTLEPLKLETPEMSPTLTFEKSSIYRPELEQLSLPSGTSDINEYKLTWMRTTPGVKPYKMMDDLTFVGIPIFAAGWMIK